MEKWAIITDVPNYEVSSEGKVHNLTTGKMLKPSFNHVGQLKVTLIHNGRPIEKLIHRLVAEYFVLDGQAPGRIVKPYDGDITNVSSSNLYWTTRGLRSWEVQSDGSLLER